MTSQPQFGTKEALEVLVSRLEEFVIVLADAEGRFTSWHPGVRRLFHYAPAEFLGRHMEILFTPADRQMGVVSREIQTAKDQDVASDTRWLARRDGSLTLVEGVTHALRHSDGSVAGFGKVLRDVTEEKRTQDRLKALTDALDESSVIVRGWDGIIQHWTAGCERLYGWAAAEAVGRVCIDLLQTVLPVSREELETQLLETGVWRGEVEQNRRDGQRVVVASQWVLIRDALHAPSQVIETNTDVTDRSLMRRELVRANEELKRMAQELERSNQELSEFARIASHDLGAPLTSAGWLVDLLANRHSQQLDENGQKCLTQVKQSLGRMSDLMDGILAHARAGMGAIRTEENSDANAALATALENLRGDIERSQARIVRHPLPPVPVNQQAMTQLFQNLLSNAIKYRKPGTHPSIDVSATSGDAMLTFAVKDEGIGVDPAWRERIFLPMQRSHNAHISGSGIGLATCRKIVTRAGGEIWVESRYGSGATFLFTLPKAVAPDGDPQAG